jgi:uncharacterized C2H2 Zn-finger protein
MGTLAGKVNLVAFEEHYLACPRCLAIVQETERYVRAMQIAAQRLRGSRPANHRPRT